MKYTMRSAQLSGDELYRYSLTREWGVGRAGAVCFVMLNPSTADGLSDDPTIRRCVSFAIAESFDSLEVVNLFAKRATDPRELNCWARDVAIGPENDAYIEAAAERAGHVVIAWGAGDRVGPRYFTQRVEHVLEVTLEPYYPLWCLGRTTGTRNHPPQPRHPLYLAADQRLEVWP